MRLLKALTTAILANEDLDRCGLAASPLVVTDVCEVILWVLSLCLSLSLCFSYKNISIFKKRR